MLFGSVAFLNTVNYHIGNSTIRLQSVTKKFLDLQIIEKWCQKSSNYSHLSLLCFTDFFLIYTLDYIREWTEKCPLKKTSRDLIHYFMKLKWTKRELCPDQKDLNRSTFYNIRNRCFLRNTTKIRSLLEWRKNREKNQNISTKKVIFFIYRFFTINFFWNWPKRNFEKIEHKKICKIEKYFLKNESL